MIESLPGPTHQLAGGARQARDSGVNQDPVDVHAAQARPETVVADGEYLGPTLLGQLAQAADGVIETAQHDRRRVVPGYVVDSGFIHVQIAPGAMLERVEILELDHEHR